ncbi:MAG: anthranilate phosphoribosyltransferase [Bradymonadaceae bacterium]
MKETLEEICRGNDLSMEASSRVFTRLIAGELSEVEITALVMALKTKGEAPAEIAGAAQALREAAVAFPRPDYAFVDTCGTGGDGAGTVNVSTAVAVVAAGMGVPVAKHGNRSVSSKCGSADVLERLGVRLDAPPEVARRCLDETGICFLFAPQYHAGVRFAMPVRRALAIRTIFNLLGPLVNPARPAYQVMGVYDPKLCVPMAETLALLGTERALIVNGCGLDELAIHGPTTAAMLQDGEVIELEISPEEAGLRRYSLSDLAGGEPEENARWFQKLLAGEGTEAHNAAVALNAGAVAWLAGKSETLADGARDALETLQSGELIRRFEEFARISHGS